MREIVIVTGGAGYIGSHTVLELLNENKYDVVSIDNYANSSPDVLFEMEQFTGKTIHKIERDLCDYAGLVADLSPYKGKVAGIIHFAALKSVGESVEKPIDYYQNNLGSMLNLLKYSEENSVECFIFSSSCSVYGNLSKDKLPVVELTEKAITECPYAETKSMGERILEDVSKNGKVKALALRYFNPVGAHESLVTGENPKSKPNNLVPVICKSALGKIGEMSVFGTDYETRDGSCIRDYIHVVDIAQAHTKAMDYLLTQQKKGYDVINLGSGMGVSVLEAITAFEKVSGKKLAYTRAPRRAGDVEAIYSNSSKAKELLNWSPIYGIEEMMKTAWDWENKLKG